MTRATWLIEPRDPIVIRDGRSTTELGGAPAFLLPPPNTVAGMVRSSFVARKSHVTPEQARQLLEIRVARGPFLVQRGSGASAYTHWLPVPSDAVVGCFKGQGDKVSKRLVRGRIEYLGEDEGVLWPEGSPAELALVTLKGKDDRDHKTEPLAEHTALWPLEAAVEWGLGHEEMEPFPSLSFGASPSTDGQVAPALIRTEGRIHVVIDDASQTAEPGMLYSTPGVRFEEGSGIAVEIETPDDMAWPEADAPVFLGGEGRTSYRSTRPEAAFPSFETYEDRFLRAAKGDTPDGIRLQLITPAWLHDGASVGAPAWLPSWWKSGRHPQLPSGLTLKLVAACLPGFVAISGWNMQGGSSARGAPRSVRRLTPAGTVFYFHLLDGHGRLADSEALLDAARALWAVPIEPEAALELPGRSRDTYLAPAARDGFGLVLPGFWWKTLS